MRKLNIVINEAVRKIAGLPWWLSSKESACNVGDVRDVGLIPLSERSSGEGNGNQLQYSCLENPMYRKGRRATVHGVTENQKRLSALRLTYMHT